MKKILNIAWNDIRVYFSDRSALIFFLVLPLLFTAIVGSLYRDGREPWFECATSAVDEVVVAPGFVQAAVGLIFADADRTAFGTVSIHRRRHGASHRQKNYGMAKNGSHFSSCRPETVASFKIDRVRLYNRCGHFDTDTLADIPLPTS